VTKSNITTVLNISNPSFPYTTCIYTCSTTQILGSLLRVLLHMRNASVPLQSFFHVSFFFNKKSNQNAGCRHSRSIFKISPISQISPSPPCPPPPTRNLTSTPTPMPLALSRSPSKPADRPTGRKSESESDALANADAAHSPSESLETSRSDTQLSLCRTQHRLAAQV
jgi:hypothetical protein